MKRRLAAALVIANVPGLALAADWQVVTEVSALRALMSDTTMEAALAGGAKATARYNADGTGELNAWGERFSRRWEINETGQLCFDYGDSTACLKIERDADQPGLFRATNQITGETQVFTVFDDGEPIELPVAVAAAGGAAAPSADEVAKSLANPNTPLATMTLKLQYRTFKGDLPAADDQSGTSALFQPAFPFPLDNGDTVFFRPAFPIVFDQPSFDADEGDFDSVAGLGDIAFDLAYGRTTENGLVWAAGMIASLPTATEDELGSDRWTLGPEFLVAKLGTKSVLGALTTYQADVAGSGDADVSLFTINAIGIYLPGGGWNVGTVPIMTYDEENSQWTVPVNLQVGKTMIFGGRPWKFGVEINYYVEQADAFGPEWMIGVNIGPVVENVMAGWF